MADFRTPLARVRGLGATKDGTGHFWRIRLSSIALVPLTLFFTGLLVSLAGAPYEEVRAAFANPLVALIALLFILASLDHMKLGMQVVIEDYIHAEGLKLTLFVLNIFFTWAIGAALVLALLKLAFGG
jgi:succinate dehydrogenase / fumarate reductase, membrane anchor subunit